MSKPDHHDEHQQTGTDGVSVEGASKTPWDRPEMRSLDKPSINVGPSPYADEVGDQYQPSS